MKYDHQAIERKWQKRWEREKFGVAKDAPTTPPSAYSDVVATRLYVGHPSRRRQSGFGASATSGRRGTPSAASRRLPLSQGEKSYVLVEFPYPSGDGLHVGHVRSYAALDAVARKRRMEGKHVLFPIGWDAFGLPTENYALKTGVHPREATDKNIMNFRRQMKSLGLSFDWSREVDTTEPSYYKWTQWVFLKLLKAGLAYQATIPISWCPKDKIGLANEEVVAGKCERCGTTVERRLQKQWMLKITAYADRLLKDLDTVDYPDRIKTQQQNWIGRSEGAEVQFELPNVKRAVLLHGFMCTHEDAYFVWLKKELEQRGIEVETPDLPNTNNAVVEEQAAYVLKNCHFDEETLVLGNSLGCAVAMKVLEKLKKSVQHLVLVGAFATPKFKDHPRPFEKSFDWKFDWEKIKKHVTSVTVLCDMTDDKVPYESSKFVSDQLEARFVEFAARKPHAEGAEEPGVLQNIIENVTLFTTRPDTLFGVTYLVLSPEHPLVDVITTAEQKKAVEKYRKQIASKSDLERTSLEKDKTGVFTGAYAVNPANNEKIPVWIADYVLMSYGTGAIMAVPAHDERDFAFATKYELPITQVIAPYFKTTEGPDAVRSDKPTVRRKTAYVFLKHHSEDKYLCLDWEKFNWHSGIIGGIEDGESPIEAAKREIHEETGYRNVRFTRQLGGETHNHYYAGHKNENRYAIGHSILFELIDEVKDPVRPEDTKNHKPVWIEGNKMAGWLNLPNYLYFWDLVTTGNDCFSGEGKLINSGQFDGTQSEDGRKKIVEWLSKASYNQTTGGLIDELKKLSNVTIPFIIGGGFAVDIHIGRVTRNHCDLDLYVENKHVDEFVSNFSKLGYRIVSWKDDTAGGTGDDMGGIWTGGYYAKAVKDGQELTVEIHPVAKNKDKLCYNFGVIQGDIGTVADSITSREFAGNIWKVFTPASLLRIKDGFSSRYKKQREIDKHDVKILKELKDSRTPKVELLFDTQIFGKAKFAVNYKLRDWVFSRQHYWGEPIPVVHCEKDGVVPVPEDQLPVELPQVEKYQPTGTGESPLAAITDWVNTTCPTCGGKATRETDTMPNWAGSSWYFLRYCDPKNDKNFFHELPFRPAIKQTDHDHAVIAAFRSIYDALGAKDIRAWAANRLQLCGLNRSVWLPLNMVSLMVRSADFENVKKICVEIGFREKSKQRYGVILDKDGVEVDLIEVFEDAEGIYSLTMEGARMDMTAGDLPDAMLGMIDGFAFRTVSIGYSLRHYQFVHENEKKSRTGKGDQEKIDYLKEWEHEPMAHWLPVDLYNGGMEHTTLHLLYSRFWHKFLYDQKLVPTPEPYQKRVSHGMVLASDGRKMSKSFGNVVNPDELVEQYGADSVRLYEMFMGPFEDAIPWDEKGILGTQRFLDRIYSVVIDDLLGRKLKSTLDVPSRSIHVLVKKISESLENLKFNTAISDLMIFFNGVDSKPDWRMKIGEGNAYNRNALEKFICLLSPFAPHLAEELWSQLGHKTLVSMESWPSYDEAMIKAEEAKIAVQVNGKLRGTLMVPSGSTQEIVASKAMELDNVKKFVPGEPKKVIFVKDRLINFVVT